MDGITEITRESLLLMGARISVFIKTLRKRMAILRIQEQPFFGKRMNHKGDATIKIRRYG